MIFLTVLDAIAMIIIFVIRVTILAVVHIVVLGFLALTGLALAVKAIALAIRRERRQKGQKGKKEAVMRETVIAPPGNLARTAHYATADNLARNAAADNDGECPYYLTSEGKVNYAAPKFPRAR